MKTIYVLAMASSLLAPAIAQSSTQQSGSKDLQAWIEAEFASVRKITIAKALDAARASGVITTAADARALKATLYAMRKQARFTGRGAMLADATAARSPNTPISRRSVVVETEFNDGPAYAEDLILQPCGSGDNSTIGDVDSWRIVATGGEWLTFDVAASGAIPIADSLLSVTNDAGQMLATNDDNFSGALSTLELYLPGGLFVANVASYLGVGGGTYDLTVSRRPANLQAIAPSGSLQTFAGTTSQTSAQDVFLFTLANDSEVAITVGSGGGGDLRMLLQTATGGAVYAVEDTAFGTDPAGDFNLPAGSYVLSIADNLGGVQPYTLTFQDTPATLGDACATGLTDNLLGDESFHLYRAVIGGPADAQFTVGAGAGNPVNDTQFYFLDRDLQPLAYIDDTIASALASYAQSVPGGVYYVGVSAYPGDFGDYTFSGNCIGAFINQGTIGYGLVQNVTLPDARGDVYDFATCTAENVNAATDFGSGAVMDATGASMMYFDESFGITSTGGPTAALIPTGNHFLVLADAYGGIPALLDFSSSVRCENGTLTSVGKSGDLAFLFAAFTRNVPGIPVIPAVNGNFCMPFGATVTVGFQALPASGLLTWPVACGSTGPALYFVQQADVHTGVSWNPGGRATFRNTLPIR